ncbi:hypothetical protein BCR44DRAFT_1485720 [Catenaria anguillulae PL171]|uniref:Fungal lipase-type domain-containing protein n=1 Tax=Catenaria anguillulae PL171 TaxID=765915 RepID=A0A1Y2HMF8_9FUNG|nr:hypothetical protein BCR44DRAFT_1485720 [Catenaria anguillulae PL171]
MFTMEQTQGKESFGAADLVSCQGGTAASVIRPNIAPDRNDPRPRLDTGQSDLTVVSSPTCVLRRQLSAASLRPIAEDPDPSLDSGDTLRDTQPTAARQGKLPYMIGPCPRTRFHRPQAFICVIQVVLSALLVSGLMLCFTILFYVLGVAGALAFAADGPAIVVAIGIAALVFVLVDLVRSFSRTGGRMLMYVWSWQAETGKDGGSHGDMEASGGQRSMSNSWRVWMCVQWEVAVERLVVRLAKPRSRHQLELCQTKSPATSPCPEAVTLENCAKLDPNSEASDQAAALHGARDTASHILAICFLGIFFFIPTVLVGSFVGYFAAISMIVFGSVAGTTLLIMLVNAFARLSRTSGIIRQLINGVPAERRLAIFVAWSGFDTKKHIIPAISGYLAMCFFSVFLIANMIQRPHLETTVPTTISLASATFFCLVRFRHTLLSWNRLPSFIRHLQGPAPSPHYFDSTSLRVPISILTLRAVSLALALVCTMAVDAFQLINSPDSARYTIALLAPFSVVYLFASLALDFTLVHSFDSPRLGGLSVIGCLSLKCAIAGYMTIGGMGCTVSFALAHAYLSINLRDSRSSWTFPTASTMPASPSNRSGRRFLIRAILVTLFILFASAVATIAGWFTDYKIRVPLPRDDPIFPSNATTISGPPRVAMPACYPLASLPGAGKLTPLDIVTLGSSVYMTNETEVHDFIRRNPRFNNRTRVVYWNGRKSKSDPPPARGQPRMAEIRWDEIPNLSVVAIRGTQSYEEMFQNLGYWLPSALIQASSHVGTLAVFWPRVLTSRLVAFLSRTFGLGELAFDRHVDAYVKDLLAQNRSVFLTGHSLGGAIGTVVGARHRVPAVAFGAPGLGFSYKAFGIELEAVAEWGVNIVMHGDPVASIDDQVGTVMGIPCTSNLPNHCHGWQSVMPNLMRTCYGYRQPEPWN